MGNPAAADATSAGADIVSGTNSDSGTLAITGGKTISRGASTSLNELPMYPSIITLATATAATNFPE